MKDRDQLAQAGCGEENGVSPYVDTLTPQDRAPRGSYGLGRAA